jgi:hypothetical protein
VPEIVRQADAAAIRLAAFRRLHSRAAPSPPERWAQFDPRARSLKLSLWHASRPSKATKRLRINMFPPGRSRADINYVVNYVVSIVSTSGVGGRKLMKCVDLLFLRSPLALSG